MIMRTKAEMYKTAQTKVNLGGHKPGEYCGLTSYCPIEDCYWVQMIGGDRYYVWAEHLENFVL